jgi:ATP-dependent Clp protease ATP-binding subunit ClpA
MDFSQFFNLSAKKAIYRANATCEQFSNQYLEPEHLFYAILNLRSCSAVQVLHQLGVNLPMLAHGLEAYIYEHQGSHKGQASFAKRTIDVFDASMKEVKRLHHSDIGTAHLLIALAQERSSFLQNLFAEHDLDASKIRNAFIIHLAGVADQLGASALPYLPEKSICDQTWHMAADSALFNVLSSAFSYGNERLLDLGRALEKLSSAARHSIEHALALAEMLENRYVLPEHVVYCMISDVRCNASRTLKEHGADRGCLVSELLNYLHGTDRIKPPVKLTLGILTLQALATSFHLMSKLDRPEINTAHLLVSILQIPDLEVRRLFDKHNLTERILEDARQVIAEVAGEELPSSSPGPVVSEDNNDSAENPSEDNGESAADEY